MTGVLIAAAAIVLITVTVFVSQINVDQPAQDDPYKNWNKSGPFNINQFEYQIGELIFISVNGLRPNDVGSIVFILPNGTTTYLAIPFDGNAKPVFNQYFKPAISKARQICDINDLVGEWTVLFNGTDYAPINFKILNETERGEEHNFSRIC